MMNDERRQRQIERVNETIPYLAAMIFVVAVGLIIDYLIGVL
jgi:hypothetical protein